MAVKYGEFKFPKSFGFTGSDGGVSVRPHMRQGYAKGGKVARRSPPLKPSPEQIVGGTIAAGAAAAAYDKMRRREETPAPPTPRSRDGEGSSAMDAVRGTTRRKREQELGLKKGGKVRKGMKNC